MYFLDEEHENNFIELIKQYCGGEWLSDVQYAANCYIAAVPDIYSLLNGANKSSGGPLTRLVDYKESDGGSHEMVPNQPGLTGSTYKLLEIGMSLYNGHPVDLDYTFVPDYANVVVQACKIRYKLVD
ncbi:MULTISPECIES: hypothetical protein [Bacillus]|uniref:hypothetical protein n=1 Tax=Bacillus TaxID=1386 RepID=UPI00273DAED6|nr:hypothetical protein [Bacillus sp. MMSF_3328]